MMHLENDPSKYKYLCTSDGAVPSGIDDEPNLDSTIVRINSSYTFHHMAMYLCFR